MHEHYRHETKAEHELKVTARNVANQIGNNDNHLSDAIRGDHSGETLALSLCIVAEDQGFLTENLINKFVELTDSLQPDTALKLL